MKAIVVREFGPPQVLRIEDVATPRPAAGQVLVRIKAAGVNPADTYVRSGTYAVKPPLPYTPGSDGAGVVEAVGEGVKRVKPGDRVFTARSVTGTYAEYAVRCRPREWHPAPCGGQGDAAGRCAARPQGGDDAGCLREDRADSMTGPQGRCPG